MAFLPGVPASKVPVLEKGGVRGSVIVAMFLEAMLLVFYALCALVPLEYTYLYGRYNPADGKLSDAAPGGSRVERALIQSNDAWKYQGARGAASKR
eukprot:1137207-Prorocentrum_lima.AAC.1